MEKIPTIAWKKEAIQNWLRSKDIPFEDNEEKRQLIEKVAEVKNKHQRYVIDEISEERGVTVLRVPPYHCELNPIESIWADIKGYVARQYVTFKLSDFKKILQEGIAQVRDYLLPESIKTQIDNIRLLFENINTEKVGLGNTTIIEHQINTARINKLH